VVIRNSFLLILSLVLVSCGAGNQKHYPVLLKGQISIGMPKSYVGDDKLISSLKRQDLILDSDRDGIIDRDDFDIDNDTIPNDCDLAPFDFKIGKSDSDKDNIPDFCDLASGLTEQNAVFEKFGVMLNLNESGDIDWKKLEGVLNVVSQKTILPNIKLTTLTMTNGLPFGEYGVYDLDWRNIRLRPDHSAHDEFPQITKSDWSLVHELFHFIGFTNQNLYSEFEKQFLLEKKNDTLMYPTEYSKVSEEEFFAEENTFQYFFSKNI
jgi:hypothetical protein